MLATQDSKTLQHFSYDWGSTSIARPNVVAFPESVEDLVAIVTSSDSDTKIKVRGGGYSFNGQSLVTGGTVICMSEMNRVLSITEASVSVEAGITWRKLLTAIPAGFAPIVVPGFLDMTVGGTICSGGYGKGSLKHGTVSENVLSLSRVGPAIATVTLPLVPLPPVISIDRSSLVDASHIAEILNKSVDDKNLYHLTMYSDGSRTREWNVVSASFATGRSLFAKDLSEQISDAETVNTRDYLNVPTQKWNSAPTVQTRLLIPLKNLPRFLEFCACDESFSSADAKQIVAVRMGTEVQAMFFLTSVVEGRDIRRLKVRHKVLQHFAERSE